MREFEVVLQVGESVQIGDHMLTVIDLDETGAAVFRIDSIPEDTAWGDQTTSMRTLPR